MAYTVPNGIRVPGGPPSAAPTEGRSYFCTAKKWESRVSNGMGPLLRGQLRQNANRVQGKSRTKIRANQRTNLAGRCNSSAGDGEYSYYLITVKYYIYVAMKKKKRANQRTLHVRAISPLVTVSTRINSQILYLCRFLFCFLLVFGYCSTYIRFPSAYSASSGILRKVFFMLFLFLASRSARFWLRNSLPPHWPAAPTVPVGSGPSSTRSPFCSLRPPPA